MRARKVTKQCPCCPLKHADAEHIVACEKLYALKAAKRAFDQALGISSPASGEQPAPRKRRTDAHHQDEEPLRVECTLAPNAGRYYQYRTPVQLFQLPASLFTAEEPGLGAARGDDFPFCDPAAGALPGPAAAAVAAPHDSNDEGHGLPAIGASSSSALASERCGEGACGERRMSDASDGSRGMEYDDDFSPTSTGQCTTAGGGELATATASSVAGCHDNHLASSVAADAVIDLTGAWDLGLAESEAAEETLEQYFAGPSLDVQPLRFDAAGGGDIPASLDHAAMPGPAPPANLLPRSGRTPLQERGGPTREVHASRLFLDIAQRVGVRFALPLLRALGWARAHCSQSWNSPSEDSSCTGSHECATPVCCCLPALLDPSSL
jgi:hypothetical protein